MIRMVLLGIDWHQVTNNDRQRLQHLLNMSKKRVITSNNQLKK